MGQSNKPPGMMSLLAWSKREGVSYSHAQKMLNDGSIQGSTRSESGKRVLVPESFQIPDRALVPCLICGRVFPQITGTHLKLHGMTTDDYKAQYPGATIVGSEIMDTLRTKSTGRKFPAWFGAMISERKKGKRPKYHPRYVKGVHRASDATKEKMRVAHTGRIHSEETKQKIGDGNRGKVMPREAVDRLAASLRIFYSTNDGPFKGKTHTAEMRAMMRDFAVAREASYTDEERAQMNRRRGDANRGKVRTEAQRERYRESRSKWMAENGAKLVDTTGERTLKGWFEARGIAYVRQFQVDGKGHPYDFYLPDLNLIVEFDGAHHWKGRWFKIKGSSQDEIAEMLVAQRAKDARENLVAVRTGHHIIRVYGVADVGCPEFGTLEEQLRAQGVWDLLTQGRTIA